jgi:polyphosphate glucokinase
MIGERRRIKTPYPLPPDGRDGLVELLVAFAAHLDRADQVAIGFPGAVRAGKILRAPHFVATFGLGTPVDPEMVRRWEGFPLRAALAQRLGVPVRVVNDAELHGRAVITGVGLEVVVTLGTGFGAAIFEQGVAAPHLELSHMLHPNHDTFDQALGNRARKRVGDTRWNARVATGLALLDEVCDCDHLYLGGGNGRAVHRDGLGELRKKVTVIDNDAGILGGPRLFAAPRPTAER